MEPITTAAVAGLTAVAADAAKEGATHVAKAAWGKLKALLGWSDDPPPSEVETRARETLAADPSLAAPAQQVVNEYHQQIAGASVGGQGGIDLRGGSAQTIKQVNIGQSSGTINL